MYICIYTCMCRYRYEFRYGHGSTVDSKMLEDGPRTIYAGCPSSPGYGIGG